MISRLVLTVALAARGVSAADFTGAWAGTATNADGAAAAMHLTVTEQDGAVAGHVVRGESDRVAVREAVVSGDELTFVLLDGAGPVRFALNFVVFGHPLGHRQVALRGTATTSIRQSTVDLYPVDLYSIGKSAIDLGPVLVHRVEPVYTEQARREKIQGTVVLRVEIEETGLIPREQIRVLRSLGHGLDEAAVTCVSKWRFRPAFRKGYAVKSGASVEVAFRL